MESSLVAPASISLTVLFGWIRRRRRQEKLPFRSEVPLLRRQILWRYRIPPLTQLLVIQGGVKLGVVDLDSTWCLLHNPLISATLWDG